MNCSMCKAKGCCSKYVGNCGIDCVIVTFVRTNVFVKGIWTNDFWDIVSYGNYLIKERKESLILAGIKQVAQKHNHSLQQIFEAAIE